MNSFTLDSRLANDCIVLGEMRLSLLLLLKNALVPWFILVPRRNQTELFELDREDQEALLEEINLLSNFVKGLVGVEKLNIAAIGNVVKQLHVHVIGRNSEDFCWPNVVWGRPEKTPYTDEEIGKIRESLITKLPEGSLRLT
ncbi:MAG: HIT family protein [Deltaproteobacteria bacterium]|nr:HIT family protein [Deltaproteobacteria bacterium]TLN02350.1 MAG: HIT family protein [bacterium]